MFSLKLKLLLKYNLQKKSHLSDFPEGEIFLQFHTLLHNNYSESQIYFDFHYIFLKKSIVRSKEMHLIISFKNDIIHIRIIVPDFI